jgi:hypothetical protein
MEREYGRRHDEVGKTTELSATEVIKIKEIYECELIITTIKVIS